MNTINQYQLMLRSSLILLSLLTIFGNITVFSQQEEENEEPEIFEIVEQMPLFPGGEEALLKFIDENIIYPQEAKAKAKEIKGIVVIGFTVTQNGSIEDAVIIREIGGGCGEEAVRLAKLMPRWSPGLQRGNPVNVAYKLPVRFGLENTDQKNYKPTNHYNAPASRKYSRTENKFDDAYHFSIGFTGGLQSPYGFGAEFSYLLGKNIDVNAGFGFGGSGLKAGIGARFFLANKSVSPYVGVNLIHATGISGIEVSSNDLSTTYNTLSDQALHIKGGIKINTFYNRYLYITGGYALPFNGYEAEYVSGYYNEQRQNFINLGAVGGIQATITYIFGFHKTKRPKWESDSWGK